MQVRKFAANLDMYRRVPGDLMEGTKRGGVVSTMAVFIMASLIFLETRSFFSSTLITDLKLDVDNDEKRLRVNFNITMLDMRCDFVSVDTVSQLGTNQNITQHVTKWNLDAKGARGRYLGRNKKQKDIKLHDETITESHDAMLKNGEDVLNLDPDDFEEILANNKYVFVDFYANWCSHCRRLAPTWERLAEVMSHVNEELIHGKEQNEFAGGRRIIEYTGIPEEAKKEEMNGNVEDHPSERRMKDLRGKADTPEDIERQMKKARRIDSDMKQHLNKFNDVAHIFDGKHNNDVKTVDPQEAAVNIDENTVGRRRLAMEFTEGHNNDGKIIDPQEADVSLDENKIGRRRLAMEFIEGHNIQLADDDDWQNNFDAEDWFGMPVVIARLDCVHYPDFCRNHQIHAYPTIRLFINGEQQPDYHGDRTVADFAHYLATMEEKHDGIAENTGSLSRVNEVAQMIHGNAWNVKNRKSFSQTKDWTEFEHPGCAISGFLMVDRTPGRFHIRAASLHHDIEPSAANVSHIVHHLSFGEIRARSYANPQNEPDLPVDAYSLTQPMDGNSYVTQTLHQAYHHYLKVVTTNFLPGKSRHSRTNQRIYQIQQQSQIAFYDEGDAPEARFHYDLSPIAVTYRRKYKHEWYDYVTSLVAIVGGSFTVFGLLDSTLYTVGRGLKKSY